MSVDTDNIKIGITLPENLSIPVDTFISNKLSIKGFSDITVLYTTDYQQQAEHIQNFIDLGCDVIIIWPADAERLIDVVEEAKSCGIIVVAYYSFINTKSVSYFCQANFFDMGVKQGEHIRDALQLETATVTRNIELLAGPQTVDGFRDLLAGVMSVLQDYFDNGILSGSTTYLSCEDCYSSYESKIIMEDIIETQGYTSADDLAAVYCCTDCVAEGVIDSLIDNQFDSMPVVTSFGGNANTLNNVSNGLQSMTIDINHNTMAEVLANAVYALLNGEDPVADDTITVDNEDIPVGQISGDIYYENEYIPFIYKRLDHIEIDVPPIKTTYYKYQNFSPSGMVVHAYYTDGTDEIVNGYGYTPYTLLLNTASVTVSYSSGGITKEAYQPVNVLDCTLTSIEAMRVRPYYFYGDTLSSADFSVMARYGSFLSRIITDFDCYPTVLSSVGNQQITFTFTEDGVTVQCSLEIQVYRKPVALDILTKPEKSAYRKGERFRRDGMKVKVEYSDGTYDFGTGGILSVDPYTINFPNGQESREVKVIYTERGVSVEKSLTVYKKTGIQTIDYEIEQNMGDCGSGFINLSTGKFRYKSDDFIGGDPAIPITVSRIYNEDFVEVGYVGVYWRLSVQQELYENNGIWKYIDKEGREHSFSFGYEPAENRSDIRNEELGFDLFVVDSNTVKLVDRDNNTLVFYLIGNKYVLAEAHKYPSVFGAAIEDFSTVIRYDSDGKITEIESGKRINQKRATLYFNYNNGKLSSLRYKFGNVAAVTVAEYSYIGDKLSSVNKCRSGAIPQYSSITLFESSDNFFVVKDRSSRDEEGNYKSLKYDIGSTGKVTGFSVGYGESDVDSASIVYKGVSGTGAEETTDIVSSAVLLHNNTVSVVSFNSMCAVSEYSYELGNNQGQRYLKPVKIYSAKSRGFDYEALAGIYSDTLDLFYDDFCNESAWQGGSISNHAYVSGNNSLCGSFLTRTYRLDSIITGDTTVYLSFWLLVGGISANPEIKVRVENDLGYGEFTHKPDGNMTNEWQFVAFNLGKRSAGDTVKLEITCANDSVIYVDEVRLTKLPYETPDDIPETEYDSFGKVSKTFGYNPVEDELECVEYTYNAERQLVCEKVTRNGDRVKKTECSYVDGLMTDKKNYGRRERYTEEIYGYTGRNITVLTDSDNVIYNYSEDTDSEAVTVIGENGSPDATVSDTYYNDSSFIKETSSGNCKNGFWYNGDGRTSRIMHGYYSGAYSSAIAFEYDTYGNVARVKIGQTDLMSAEYDYKHLNKITYADGDYVEYGYDDKDRLISVGENGSADITVSYADTTRESVTVTHPSGLEYKTNVVNAGGITGESIVNFGNSRKLRVVGYAASGAAQTENVGIFIGEDSDVYESRTIEKDGDGRIRVVSRSGHGGSNSYYYDDMSRLTEKKTRYAGGLTDGFGLIYGYENLTAERTTSRVTTDKLEVNGVQADEYSYTYYANGNVKRIYSDGTIKREYKYDGLGRLVREDNYSFNKAYCYTYNSGGNITEKKTYALINGEIADTPERIDTYDYTIVSGATGQNAAWKDQLKKYNDTTITYDASGNPLDYLGKAMTWRCGKLTAVNGVTLGYDYNGLRISKGNRRYYRQDNSLIYEEWEEGGNTKRIYYYYDESGITGFNYNGEEYYYRKNIFGDVLAIYRSGGVLQCRYEYDAWGNHKVYDGNGTENMSETFIGNVNPIRYRGYYWDKEFGLYYLQTRYYDPLIGRFISPDKVEYLDPEDVQGLNLYAYCGNNPVMRADPEGTAAISSIIIGLIIGAVAGVIIGGVTAGISAYEKGAREWELFGDIALGALGGAVIGGIIGAGIGYIAPTIGTFLGSSFTLFSFTNAMGELIAVSVTGAQISATGLATLTGIGIIFSSTDRPRDNRKQNEQYREAMKRLGYSKKDWQWRYGHDHLPNERLGFKDLLKFLEDLFNKFK